MINYVTLGTNDLAKSAEFCDQLLEEFGAKRVMASERMVFGWLRVVQAFPHARLLMRGKRQW